MNEVWGASIGLSASNISQSDNFTPVLSPQPLRFQLPHQSYLDPISELCLQPSSAICNLDVFYSIYGSPLKLWNKYCFRTVGTCHVTVTFEPTWKSRPCVISSNLTPSPVRYCSIIVFKKLDIIAGKHQLHKSYVFSIRYRSRTVFKKLDNITGKHHPLSSCMIPG